MPDEQSVDPTEKADARHEPTADLNVAMVDLVREVVAAMGLALDPRLEEIPDGVRIDLEGDGSETLLRRKGEALQALQHIVTMAFRDKLGTNRRVVVDCSGYRKDQDAELRQMAAFLAERAKSSGVEQELGPLNPYERRIVHLAIAEDTTVSSYSIGDAFMKRVIISPKRL